MKKNVIRWVSVLCVIALSFAGIAAGAEADADSLQDAIPAAVEEVQEQSISSEAAEEEVLSVTDPAEVGTEADGTETETETPDLSAEGTDAADSEAEETGEQGTNVIGISEATESSAPEAEETDTEEAAAGQTETIDLPEEETETEDPATEATESSDPEEAEIIEVTETIEPAIVKVEEPEVTEPVTEEAILPEPATEVVPEIVIETVIEEQPEIRTEEALVPIVEEIVIEQPEEEQTEESLDVTEDKDTLYYGMYSNAVTELQKALRNKGYDIWPDGYYGSDTEMTVKMFQMFNGMNVTGVADAAVIKAAKGNGIRFSSFSKGAYAYVVAALQTMLRDLGYLQANIDGSFGPYTEQAVIYYQEKNGLYVDGVVGLQTLKSILTNPISFYTVTSSEIMKLQTRLDQLGFLQSAIDGDYGTFTKRAVKEFQMYNGLGVTGTVDSITYSALRSASATAFYELSSGAAGYPVLVLQTILQNLGYLSVAPDGDFGPLTRLAVAKFQAMNGLTVDGSVNQYTLNRLFLGGLAYDPSTDHLTSKAEQLAKDRLNQIGWDLYTAYRWSSDFPHTHAYTGLTLSAAAVYGFAYGKGDCMAKASTFCMMARALGYQCKVIFGYVPYSDGTYADHAWCEIQYYGTTYICDPSFEYGSGKNGYMINYGQSGTLKYVYGNLLEE